MTTYHRDNVRNFQPFITLRTQHYNTVPDYTISQDRTPIYFELSNC